MSKQAKDLAADIVTVDMRQIDHLVQRGAEIVMQPEAEEALLTLLELQTKINNAVAEAKRAIEQKALEFNPNFASVQASKLKVGYQYFGARYLVDTSLIDKLPKDMYKEKISYSVVPKAVEQYVKTNNSLPLGILERDRAKRITIKPLAQAEEDEAEE